MASVVEDVLNRSQTLDLDSRRAQEAGILPTFVNPSSIRRYEGAAWLRKMVGVVGAKDLPAEPSEEEFRLGLRSGLILCNVLNKVHPGAVSKVVESSCDSAAVPDGAALSAFQYFENARNFLVAVEKLGLPTFEASDLEQGGKSSRIVNCVLALKSYSEWKQAGGHGTWRSGGTVKPSTPNKNLVRKNSDPFASSLSRTNGQSQETDNNKMHNSSLSTLVRAVLMDKKPDEVPILLESLLSKVMEEFEHRIASQVELQKPVPKDAPTLNGNRTFLKHTSCDVKVEDKRSSVVVKDKIPHKNSVPDEEVKRKHMRHQMAFDAQQEDIMSLRKTLSTTKAGMQFMQKKFLEEIQNLGQHIFGLAHAASGYHRVLEENRKLYNQVQDLKGNIRVYCRVRPFLGRQSNVTNVVDCIEEGTITVNTPPKYGKGRRSFNFNKVFGPSATQEEVFEDTRPLIRSVLDGYNVCIFAYGQTGSGKTHTMSGPKDLTENNQGVNYRALSDLFYLAEQRKGTFQYDVSVQMIEIYNEQIRNNSQNGFNVPEASLARVSSTFDVIELMNLGQRNRAVGATALNDRSSRSHSCLTVHVQGRDLTSGGVLRGCMHLVDLAGSERVDKSEVTGDRLKEAQHINKSLSALGDVIASLAQKNTHVPYRNSKLTQLLQDSLGGQAKTLMFVHISPELDAVGETLSTLKFAERVATVELGAARVNKDSSDVKELKEQIANLKAALARKEGEHESVQVRRKPTGEIGNTEARKKYRSRQKTQSIDLDELLGNSPPWPPVSSPGETYGEDDREIGSGDWVDKVMVNKQDGTRGTVGCWEPENSRISDSFYQKYLPEQSFNIFPGGNGFDVATTDDLDELDAATSDSSEPDLLWQFNHSKLSSLTNGGMSKVNNLNAKSTRSPELSSRTMIPNLGPSPSKKMTNMAPQRGGRPVASAEFKRKTGNRVIKPSALNHARSDFYPPILSKHTNLRRRRRF
ncbi:hypothetical protein QVD17_16980 [Tagetes erecta]|uniref:Uncharacterized protein n=1 Tax=Tagetes erecta TaxID=13708 RepID=A0AAD8KS94_TARER|nr:hypothetical protein QVD17_16980 [Tagetes erecta]